MALLLLQTLILIFGITINPASAWCDNDAHQSMLGAETAAECEELYQCLPGAAQETDTGGRTRLIPTKRDSDFLQALTDMTDCVCGEDACSLPSGKNSKLCGDPSDCDSDIYGEKPYQMTNAEEICTFMGCVDSYKGADSCANLVARDQEDRQQSYVGQFEWWFGHRAGAGADPGADA